MLIKFENPLFYYIYHRDIDSIKHTVNAHPEFLTSINEVGDTPLHYVIKLSDLSKSNKRKKEHYQWIAHILFQVMKTKGLEPEKICNKNSKAVIKVKKQNENMNFSLSDLFKEAGNAMQIESEMELELTNLPPTTFHIEDHRHPALSTTMSLNNSMNPFNPLYQLNNNQHTNNSHNYHNMQNVNQGRNYHSMDHSMNHSMGQNYQSNNQMNREDLTPFNMGQYLFGSKMTPYNPNSSF